ncbi:MAG TPA: ATP-binding protein [Roseiflexaceae bacterium]|nr:ATP-binding protein [Roseiflexaceae bacterium]HMP39814.1 ATP-binding protein [Roseiflexaceae bacterium]
MQKEETTLVGTDNRARAIGMALINISLGLVLISLYAILKALFTPAFATDPMTPHMVATVAVAVAVVPIRRRLVAFANRMNRREWQDTRDLTRDITGILSRTIDPAGLCNLLCEDLPGRLRLTGATLWMLEPPENRVFVALGHELDHPGVLLLANGASVTQVRYEFDFLRVPTSRESDWAPPFQARDVALVLPLRVGDRLIGFYGLGAPKNGRDYSNQVLDVLATLAPAIGSALENTRAYTEIAQLNSQLRALDQRKDEFIEHVGHELRTPLTSLTLAMQLLTRQPEMVGEFAHVLRNSVMQLQSLVDRVLSIDRRQSNESSQPIANTSVELAPLFDEITTEYAHAARMKGIMLTIAVPEGLAIWGDRAMLRRALHELVDNAVRYSTHGEITLSAVSQDGLALIRVADQGPGIPLEERDQLFDTFYRGRRVRALAESPGSGLGLSLARRDVELLGGRLWLDQTNTSGSVMCIALPAVKLTYHEYQADPLPYYRP